LTVGLPGLPPNPAYQDSHGTTVARHGVWNCWAAVDTGWVVSGVDVVRIRSTLFDWISCWASWAARSGLDWVSAVTISML
jgi:hypothetical protein